MSVRHFFVSTSSRNEAFIEELYREGWSCRFCQEPEVQMGH